MAVINLVRERTVRNNEADKPIELRVKYYTQEHPGEQGIVVLRLNATDSDELSAITAHILSRHQGKLHHVGGQKCCSGGPVQTVPVTVPD